MDIEAIIQKANAQSQPQEQGSLSSTMAGPVSQMKPKEEVQPAPQTQEPKQGDKDPLSSRYSNLIKREQEILNKERELKDKLSKFQQPVDYKKKAQEDPFAFLEEHGLSYEDLTSRILEDGKHNPLERKLSEIEKKLQLKEEDDQKRLAAEQDRKYNEVISTHKASIKSHIEANKDKLEILASNDLTDDVFAVIEEHFSRTKEVMPMDAACDLVEERYFEEIKKYMKASKVRALFEGVNSDVSGNKPAQDNKQDDVTLTQALTHSVGAEKKDDLYGLSDDEKINAIIAKYTKQ